MKRYIYMYMLTLFTSLMMVGCNEQLTELNENPNGVDPGNANVNLLLPGLLSRLSGIYADLDHSVSSGVVQHMQEDGWYAAYNHYVWTNRDWNGWYEILRNNDLLIKTAANNNLPMHEGIGYVVRAFAFGNITDLWGDAPYTEALKAGQDILQPTYDDQEVIYSGILEDLQHAATLFQSSSNSGIIAANDLIYQGDIGKWNKLANTLILRYAMRLSEKLPDLASQYIRQVYERGTFIDNAADNAYVDFLGNSSANSWYLASQFDPDGSSFRRRKFAKVFMDKLRETNDPRLYVWAAPVNCQWVEDLSLTVPFDDFVRKNGVPQAYNALTYEQYVPEIAAGNKFTRHYNPNLLGYKLDTDLYVGIAVGSLAPDAYNNNPTPGQTVQNQHVSQLNATIYRQSTGTLLKRRLASSSETYFILAEAAQRGWISANAGTFYNQGIQQSLQTWGAGDQYESYISRPDVAYDGRLETIIEQKWVASWNSSTEAWMDFRRTGFPALVAGEASGEPVLPVRFIYGNNELSSNEANANAAINKLEETRYSNVRGKNSQWSKMWLLQGTGKPW